MSYESEVLADNPVFYARLDDNSGSTVMHDLSASGNDGSFYSDAGFGLASPIETDASSKAISNHVGFVRVEDESFGAFTWEAWGLHTATSIAGALITRGGQIGLSASNFLVINDSNAAAQISVGGVSYSLSYSLGNAYAWYHLVVTRNGNVMRLYVNGVLVAERTDLGLGDITGWGIPPDATNPNQYTYIGTGQTADVWHSAGTDEPAIYTTALTAARVLAHYEAAKASLPLRATIVINVSVELNTDQIQPVDLPFGHNYSQTFGSGSVPIVETLEFQTNTNKSEPDYEQRISARPHGPLRNFEYHLSPKSGAGRAQLQGLLYQPAQFYTLPIWRDVGTLTAQATAGDTTLSLDTTKRDYEVGSYVGLCTDPRDVFSYEFFQIVSVADGSLTLASTIGTTVASGSFVFPARVCSISDDTLSVHSYAADHEDAVIRFDVIESELSTRIATTYSPSITYRDIEVFSLEAAKVNFMDERPADLKRRIQAHGRDYQYAQDTGSPQIFPVRFLLTDRDALSQFYGWLNSRNGSLSPLWVSSKEQDLIVTASTGSTITVKRTGFSLHDARRDLEFLKTDGTLVRSRVTAIISSGATETWTVSAPAFTDIARVSFLKFCVLSSDTVTLRHFKGGISECSLSFRELLTTPT
jgi:hypothetical protein